MTQANEARIIMSAQDKTAGAIASARRGLSSLADDARALDASVLGLGAGMGTLAGALAGVFSVASIKGAIDAADQLDDLAEKTGISVQQLGALRYAGEVTGTSTEALAGGIRKLTQNMAAAAGGSKEQAAAFQAMGVRVTDSTGKLRASDEVLGDLADRFALMPDGPEKAAMAMEVFGKSGQDMIPLLNKGSAGIAQLRAEAQRLGVVMDGDVAKQAADFNDNIKRLQLSGQGFATTVAGEMLPTLNTLASAMLATRDGSNSTASMLGKAADGVLKFTSLAAVNAAGMADIVGKHIGGLAAKVSNFLGDDNPQTYTVISNAVGDDVERAKQKLRQLQYDILGVTNSKAGAGRGALPDGRTLGAVPSIEEQTIGWSKAKSIIPHKDGDKPKESDYDKLIKRIGTDLAKANADAAAAQMGYNKAQADFLVLAASPEWAALTNQQRATVAALYEQRIAAEQLKTAEETALKTALKAAEDRQHARQAEAAAIDAADQAQRAAWASSLASVNGRLESLKDESAAADLVARGNVSLAEAVELVTIARLREKQAGFMAGSEGYEAIERELAARRELLTLIGQAEVRKANEDAAKKAADDWQRTADQINQSLTDAIMSGGRSGAEYLQDLFRTLVLRPIVSAVVQTGVNTLGNAMGLSSLLGGGGQVGGIGMLGNLGSMGSIGSLLGFGGSAAAATGVATNIGLGVQAGLSVGEAAAAANAASAAGASAAGAGGLSGALSAAGPYLAALAVVSSLFEDDSGTYHTGASSSYSAAQGLSGATPNAEGWFAGMAGMADAVFSAQTQSTTDVLVKSIVGVLDATATSFGKQAGYSAATAFADDTSKDGAWGALSINLDGKSIIDWAATQTSRWAPKEFADGAAGQAQYTAAVAASVRDTLRAMDLPGWAASVLDQLGNAPTLESLSAALDGINATRVALDGLADTMPQLATLTDATTTRLLALAGGTATLQQAAGAYYQAFYTEAERTATTTRQVGDALAAVGLQLPTTRDAFRALVEAQDLTTDSGVVTYAALLNVASAFASVTPEAVDTSLALGDLLDWMPQLRNLTSATSATVAGVLGGASNVTSAARQYYDAFYSDAERTAASTRTIAQALDAVGLQLPATRDEFRALVEAQDLSTQSGATTYATLLSVADAFATVTDAAQANIDALLDQARANASTLVDYQRAVARIRMGDGAGTTAASTALPASALGFDAYTTSAVTASYTAPAATAPAAGGDASAALAAEVRALRTEVEGLRAEARATALNTAATTRLLDRVSEGGDALRTVAA